MLEIAENNYKKLFGMDPVWSGTHKELGTSNSLFNFKNTYFELLAATGEGLGADLVNHYLTQDGEGLIGIVFATDDIKNDKKMEKCVFTPRIKQRFIFICD